MEGQDYHHCPDVMRPPLYGVDRGQLGRSNEALQLLPAVEVS